MLRFPNAKINIGLFVTERRPDGYHNLETVFYPIGLKDALEIIVPPVPQVDCTLRASGIAIDAAPADNLILRAYRLLQRDFSLPPVDIYLHKAIPFGAGLGGGSANAAFMLTMLNKRFALNLSNETLEQYASQLGADCAFFVRNRPVFATGIGNLFQNIELSLANYVIALVKPPIHVSTALAYANITPRQPAVSLPETLKLPVAEWNHAISNDFEPGVFERFPTIGEVKTELYRRGALYASMSGSGSAVYGIFENTPKLNRAFPEDYFIYINPKQQANY